MPKPTEQTEARRLLQRIVSDPGIRRMLSMLDPEVNARGQELFALAVASDDIEDVKLLAEWVRAQNERLLRHLEALIALRQTEKRP
jgi:hypothetical protein